MLYFCFRQEIGTVEDLAEMHFKKSGASYWRTYEEMGGCRRGFFLFPDVFSSIPGSNKYKSALRVYEEDLERMLEGSGAARRIEGFKERYPYHKITLARVGQNIILRAYPSAGLPSDAGMAMRDPIPISWFVGESTFTEFMRETWENEKWDVYDDRLKEFRPDIAHTIVWDKVPYAKNPNDAVRVVFTPTVYDLMGIKGVGIIGGGAVPFVRPDGKVQEHDEDGKPVGEPYNPHALGGEDMIPEIPPANLQIAAKSQPIPTEFDEDGHPCGYMDNSVAEACGVDMSQFGPSPYDD